MVLAFNGAADLSRRKAPAVNLGEAERYPLQWGRRPESAEGRSPTKTPPSVARAFNGAADLSRRKDRLLRLLTASARPSMGPPT